MTAKTEAQTYKDVVAAEHAGRPVLPADLEAAVAYAKRTKRRAPKAAVAKIGPPEAVAEPVPAGSVAVPARKATPAKATAKASVPAPRKGEPKADKPAKPAKAPKAPADKRCADTDKKTGKRCTKDAVAKGRCAAHYAAARREDPAERAKANAASKAYYERQRAASAPKK